MTSMPDAIEAAWRGEIGGARLFARLAEQLPLTPAQAAALAALTDLERVMAVRIARHLAVPDEPADRTDAFLARHPIIDWNGLLDFIDTHAPPALARFRAIAGHPAMHAIGALLVDHEEALIAFATAERAGDPRRALAIIRASRARIGG
jgi:hypothetical protein